jgi:hypothetical protein
VIEHDDKTGQIISITPIFTIMRVMNSYGILTARIVNIPNLLLVRERVIILRRPTIADHEFSIMLSLKDTDNIFKIINEIGENILNKNLSTRVHNINPDDNEVYKASYEQVDVDKIRITFSWRATAKRNRKIERKILGYLKYMIDYKKLHSEKMQEESPLYEKKQITT